MNHSQTLESGFKNRFLGAPPLKDFDLVWERRGSLVSDVKWLTHYILTNSELWLIWGQGREFSTPIKSNHTDMETTRKTVSIRYLVSILIIPC